MLHPRKREIVSRIIYGEKLSDLSREFSVSEDSLWRFKKNGEAELIAQEQLRLMANDLLQDLEKRDRKKEARPKGSTWTLYPHKLGRPR
jgi:hypothetical protein